MIEIRHQVLAARPDSTAPVAATASNEGPSWCPAPADAAETADLSATAHVEPTDPPTTEPGTTASSETTAPVEAPVGGDAPGEPSADQTTTELGETPRSGSRVESVGLTTDHETVPLSDPETDSGPTTEPMPAVATPPLPPEQPPHHHVGRHEEAHDRVWPHFLWELLLLLGVGVLAAIYWAQETPGFEADQLKPLFWSASILGLLAGREHELWTGVCLWRRPGDVQVAWQEVSRVAVKAMSRTEVDTYLATRTWRGCSGAYAIQEGEDPFVRVVRHKRGDARLSAADAPALLDRYLAETGKLKAHIDQFATTP